MVCLLVSTGTARPCPPLLRQRRSGNQEGGTGANRPRLALPALVALPTAGHGPSRSAGGLRPRPGLTRGRGGGSVSLQRWPRRRLHSPRRRARGPCIASSRRWPRAVPASARACGRPLPSAAPPALQAPASHPPAKGSPPPPVLNGVGRQIDGSRRDPWLGDGIGIGTGIGDFYRNRIILLLGSTRVGKTRIGFTGVQGGKETNARLFV